MLTSVRRKVPLLEGIPPSPSKINHGKRKAEYGGDAIVRFPNSLFLFLIETYQQRTVDKPHICNHYPSCSEYSRISYMLYGWIPASLMTLERMIECGDGFSDWPRENRP